MTRPGRPALPVAAILVVVGLSSCSGSTVKHAPALPPPLQPLAGQAETLAVSPRPTIIAKLMAPTSAFSEPAGTRVVTTLSTAIRPGGGPTELLVLDRRPALGREWLRVLLPVRPNGTTGWIEAAVARLSTSRFRIVISTERRTVEGFDEDRRIGSFRAVVGAPGTPTPHGFFAVAERIPLANPGGFYGTWMLTLTAHSNVLDTFDGGDGRVAIHGRGGSSLEDPLGSASSHGCIRLDNSAIDWLARIAAPGTPVVVL